MRRIVASRMGALLLSCCAATSRAWGDEPPRRPTSRRCPLPSRPRLRARPGRCWSSRGPHVGVPAVASRRLGSRTEPPGRPGRLAGPHRPLRDARARPRRVDRGVTPPPRRAGSTSPWSWTGSPTRSCPTPLGSPVTRREAPPPIRRGPRFFGRFAPPSALVGRGSTATGDAVPDERRIEVGPGRRRRAETSDRTPGPRGARRPDPVGRGPRRRPQRGHPGQASRFWQRGASGAR